MTKFYFLGHAGTEVAFSWRKYSMNHCRNFGNWDGIFYNLPIMFVELYLRCFQISTWTCLPFKLCYYFWCNCDLLRDFFLGASEKMHKLPNAKILVLWNILTGRWLLYILDELSTVTLWTIERISAGQSFINLGTWLEIFCLFVFLFFSQRNLGIFRSNNFC